MDTFWMVYGEGKQAPTMKHHHFEAAKKEATRLARANPGVEFVVLQSIATAKKTDVEFRMMDSGEMSPF